MTNYRYPDISQHLRPQTISGLGAHCFNVSCELQSDPFRYKLNGSLSWRKEDSTPRHHMTLRDWFN